ncbi:MAG TPA: glycosyltransferase family 9 protein [Vicinamibacteria bacterium]|nr:glycosyltransferase family 9 protein [Vicinamibacteria bacterium]
MNRSNGSRSCRILAIRLHALGDVVITLPYLNDVKRRNPDFEIDLLTRREFASIPRSLELFSRIHAVTGGRQFKLQCLFTSVLLPRLISRDYDVVVDLQNNEISRAVTRFLRPHRTSRFDTTAPRPAGERTREALDAAGLGPAGLDADLVLRKHEGARDLLAEAGFRKEHRLIVLNPAGAFPSRNWPVASYARFARAWQKIDDRPTSFLVLGLPSMKRKAEALRAELDGRLLDLVGLTTPSEAFAIVRKADLVLSEDSGLMHMAWSSGVPTIALFGSSRGDWSRPLGARSICLDSGDLECGYCMEELCRFGDVRCLTRYEPARVAELGMKLVMESR